MRQSFDLLTVMGWRNLWMRRFDSWALRWVVPDTFNHAKCLVLGHAFDDGSAFGGHPWCQRCYMVTRPPQE